MAETDGAPFGQYDLMTIHNDLLGYDQLVDIPTESDGFLDDGFLAARQHTWTEIDQETKLVKGCSDDRPKTQESAAAIDAAQDEPDVLSVSDGYARQFGGLIGEANAFLVAGSAVHGPRFIEVIGGIRGAMSAIIRLNGKRETVHTAAGSESGAVGFDADSDKPHGCAYGMNTSEISRLNLGDQLIREVGVADQVRIFGSEEGVDNLMLGTRFVLLSLVRKTNGSLPAPFHVSRRDYASLQAEGAQVATYAGTHLPADSTGLVHSFSLDRVSNPALANRKTPQNPDGLGYYAQDVALVTDSLGQLLKEHGVPPAMYMRAAVLGSTSVRALLAGPDDRGIDPRRLAIAVAGDPAAAIDELDFRYGN